MSFDLTLPTTCNHLIYRELDTLADDRRSLRLALPLANSGNMQVYASDNLVPNTEYIIIYDPSTITIQQPRMIYFNYKWPGSSQDFFQINYNTLRGFCPKCVGLNTLDDISWDVRGQTASSTNETLLLQNLEKFVITDLQSNPFHTFIGTILSRLLGQRITDVDYLKSRVTQEIHTTLGKLKDMQQQYVQAGRTMTPGEQLNQIQDVKVTQDPSDPTIFRVDVRVTSMSGQPLQFSQYLRANRV
jgi:hypothetical protein